MIQAPNGTATNRTGTMAQLHWAAGHARQWALYILSEQRGAGFVQRLINMYLMHPDAADHVTIYQLLTYGGKSLCWLICVVMRGACVGLCHFYNVIDAKG